MAEFATELMELGYFIRRLTGKERLSKDLSLLWTLTSRTTRETIMLEKEWKKLKKQPAIVRKRLIRRDLDSLIRRLGADMPNNEDVVKWGIRTTQEALEILPLHLPYLREVAFEASLLELSRLLGDIYQAGKRNKMLSLLRDASKTKDLVTTSQFYLNEMVGYYRYLSRDRSRIVRRTLWKHIQIYQELCGIYEKDILVCYCLLQIEENNKPNYAEIRKNTREIQDRINFVKRRMPLLVKPYDRVVRNAKAHTNIEVDSKNRLVKFYEAGSETPIRRSFEDVISLTRQMSAVVSTFRLLPVVLANRDWKALKAMLE